MEVTITLQQQREMLINQIAQFKAEGKEIEFQNAQSRLRKFDEATPTGLKYKYSDGKVYEIFRWFYISHVTNGKKYVHSYFRHGQMGVIEDVVYKKECFK